MILTSDLLLFFYDVHRMRQAAMQLCRVLGAWSTGDR